MLIADKLDFLTYKPIRMIPLSPLTSLMKIMIFIKTRLHQRQ
jgi:hypothetical protein